MRKYVRRMIKERATEDKIKPSKMVAYVFNKLQIKKYGIDKRNANQYHGTHPKRLWKNREIMQTSTSAFKSKN